LNVFGTGGSCMNWRLAVAVAPRRLIDAGRQPPMKTQRFPQPGER
jgi:hypothetical protein